MKHSKIFVINLDQHTDRWKHMERQLSKNYAIEYERFPGIYGKHLTKERINQIATARCAQYCPLSVIGCAASHIAVWKRAIQENLDYVIVFEDDIDLFPGWERKIMHYIHNDNNDYDIILLGTHNNDDLLPSFIINYNRFIDSFLLNDSNNVKGDTFFLGTHCYMVSKNGLRKLAEAFKMGISWHLDTSMSNRGLKLKRVPRICNDNHDFESANSQESILTAWSNNNKLKWIMGMPVFRVGTFHILQIHIILFLLTISTLIVKIILFSNK